MPKRSGFETQCSTPSKEFVEPHVKVETTYIDLPTECLLRVLSLLALPDIAALLRTSKLWNSIITINEQTVYRELANQLDAKSASFASPADALDGWLSLEATGVQSWKEYCRLFVITERRWKGKDRPFLTRDTFKSAQQIRVGWIKIDTEKALLIMTGDEELDEDNCAIVHCLRDPTREALFRLNQARTFLYSHRNIRRVWRWAEDQVASQLTRQPTHDQLQKYERATISFGTRKSPRRGELLPMGVLKQPDDLRAYRLVYPTLCVGSHVGDQLWLWDIRTRDLIQTIHIEPSPYQEFSMIYVDINESYVFVATHTVSIYDRATGECAFRLKEIELRRLAGYVTPPVPVYGSENVFLEYALPGYHDPDINVTPPYLLDIVVAVHASPTGDDCVAITHWGYIILISGLKHEVPAREGDQGPANVGVDAVSTGMFRGVPKLANIKVSLVRAEGTLHYLAYDGRRILVFGSHGLALINLDRRIRPVNNIELSFSNHTLAKLSPFPAPNMHLVPPFAGVADIYRGCTCLQMTADSCWMAWSPEGHESLMVGRGDPQISFTKTVGMIDFTRAAFG